MRYDGESCLMISSTGTVQQISFGRENQRNDILTRMDGKRTHGFGVKTWRKKTTRNAWAQMGGNNIDVKETGW